MTLHDVFVWYEAPCAWAPELMALPSVYVERGAQGAATLPERLSEVLQVLEAPAGRVSQWDLMHVNSGLDFEPKLRSDTRIRVSRQCSAVSKRLESDRGLCKVQQAVELIEPFLEWLFGLVQAHLALHGASTQILRNLCVGQSVRGETLRKTER